MAKSYVGAWSVTDQLLTLTETSDAVEDVAGFTLAAVRAYQVDATVTCTDLFGAFTLVDICGGKQQETS